MGSDAMILVLLILTLKPGFSLCSFTLIKRIFSSSSLSATRVVSSTYLKLLMFLPPSFDLQSSCIFVPKRQKDYKNEKICFHGSLSETLRYIPSCYFLLLTFL